MNKKELELYKGNKEAQQFIRENPELFKPSSVYPNKKQPEPKVIISYEDTFLVRPKHRAVLQDVLANLTNKEIMDKHGYKSVEQVAAIVHRARKLVLDKIKSGSHLLKNTSIIKFKDFVDKRVFTYRGKTEEVFLVKVRTKYILSYQIFDEDHIQALIYKASLLESQMPSTVRKQWRHLTGKLIFVDQLKAREELLHFLNHYRWVDKDGVIFKPTVDILLSSLHKLGLS